MALVVAVIAPGMMGSAVGKRLCEAGAEVRERHFNVNDNATRSVGDGTRHARDSLRPDSDVRHERDNKEQTQALKGKSKRRLT